MSCLVILKCFGVVVVEEGRWGEAGSCILPTVVRYTMRGKGRKEYTK